MARFQGGGASSEDVPSTPTGPLHATKSSGPTWQTKKPISGSNLGSATPAPLKPTFLKNTTSSKSDTDIQEPHTTKALAARFANTQVDANTNNKPLILNKQPPHPLQAPESKSSQQKTTINKPPVICNKLDSKPGLPKPSPAFSSKPSWVKDDSGGVPSNGTPPKGPSIQSKRASSIHKLRQQNEEIPKPNMDITSKPFLPPSSALKPISNFRTAQNVFDKETNKSDQSDADVTEDGPNKPPLSAYNATPPPKPLPSKKPSLKKPIKPPSQTNDNNDEATSGPKRNPLLNSLSLGAAPAKPNRPPNVNLESFRRGAGAADYAPGTLKKPNLLPPLPSHPSNNSNQAIPTQPTQPTQAPSLPPRHPGAIIQPDSDENYDDVGLINSSPPPPPLPPVAAHPSRRPKLQSEDSSDGEMYEDLEERWDTVELKEQEKKREKEEKEEKKRLEAEKKEHKEREKKEQDARKKFKLVGPLEVIQKGKALVDVRGGKTDLSLKHGECVDIIRVQGNPEGKWLGQTQDGSIGYVKITSVEIDFHTLKSSAVSRASQQEFEPEIYDDIDVASDSVSSGIRGPGVVLPPPPEDDGEIYDDVIDSNLAVSPLDPKSSPNPLGFLRMFERNRRPASSKTVPPPSQFTTDGSSVQPGAAIDEEIYDDVDAQNLPPLPPISSIPTLKGKNKNEEVESRKLKKFEKEEKDFRKKFKYEGPIQVLYQVTIIPTLTIKKWSGKDLPVKPGENLDVIVKAVDNKLICRNDEGKFGYVLTSHIVTDDGEIYDDIGDECIYDNE